MSEINPDQEPTPLYTGEMPLPEDMINSSLDQAETNHFYLTSTDNSSNSSAMVTYVHIPKSGIPRLSNVTAIRNEGTPGDSIRRVSIDIQPIRSRQGEGGEISTELTVSDSVSLTGEHLNRFRSKADRSAMRMKSDLMTGYVVNRGANGVICLARTGPDAWAFSHEDIRQTTPSQRVIDAATAIGISMRHLRIAEWVRGKKDVQSIQMPGHEPIITIPFLKDYCESVESKAVDKGLSLAALEVYGPEEHDHFVTNATRHTQN